MIKNTELQTKTNTRTEIILNQSHTQKKQNKIKQHKTKHIERWHKNKINLQ